MLAFELNTKSMLPQNIFTIVFSMTLGALTIFGQTQTEPDVRPLTLGQAVERELKSDAAHSYTMALQAGQFLNVVVEQKGIDVVVALFDSDNKKVAEIDSPNGTQGAEPLSVIIEKTGNYRLEVRSLDKTAPVGHYEAKIVELRTATEKDKNRIAANKAFSEAEALRQQGTAESLRNAIKKYEESLPYFRSLEDRQKEAETLNYIGLVYKYLGEQQQALKYYNESLQLSCAIGDKTSEAITLSNIGKLYAVLGEQRQSLKFYNEAVLLFRATGDKSGEAVTLMGSGTAYSALGELQQALKLLNESLQLRRAIDDKSGEARTLSDIGNIYSNLGEKQRALKYLNESLQLTRAVGGDKRGEAVTLLNIGAVYSDLGEHQKALKFFDESLQLRRVVGDKNGEAYTLNGIGKIYSLLGEQQQALKLYDESLPLLRATSDKDGEAVTINNIGAVYDILGEKQKALEFFLLSLPLSKSVGDKSLQANTLGLLMIYWKSLNNLRLAVLYGKQSVNLYQELRQNINALDKGSQKTYLKTIEGTYRKLADILITQGRIPEAEQVLEMLKEEEYFDFLRRDDKVASELKAKISLTSDESDAFANYEKLADKITQIGKEFGELEKKRNALPLDQSLAAAEQVRYDELKKQLADANQVFNAFLDELKVKFGQKDVRIAMVESDTQGILKRLKQPHTVIISTVAGEDRLSLIVTTADVQRAHTVDIKAADLNLIVLEFRDAVKNPNIDPRFSGKKLYDVLFPADLQKDLYNIKADTIVWSLDGTLRYAPIAALWDGKQYLVERYTNAILTLASRDKIVETTTDRTKWLALGVGVSKQATLRDTDGTPHDFPALTAVPKELCSVVADPKQKDFCSAQGSNAGVIKGISLFNDEFTLSEFQKYLGRTPVVHIASHFSLNAGNEADSYLLLGGKQTDERKFTLAKMKNETNLTGVELLTLSACNTAMTAGEKSNGVEVEGFGALAQNKGAKSVLASLWSVADASTRDLMIEFYKQLETNPNVGKAEALRKAQLKLINGKYTANEAAKNRGTQIIDLSGKQKQPEFKRNDNAPFAHPFYWSPFVLFGNWQ